MSLNAIALQKVVEEEEEEEEWGEWGVIWDLGKQTQIKMNIC